MTPEVEERLKAPFGNDQRRRKQTASILKRRQENHSNVECGRRRGTKLKISGLGLGPGWSGCSVMPDAIDAIGCIRQLEPAANQRQCRSLIWNKAYSDNVPAEHGRICPTRSLALMAPGVFSRAPPIWR
jgi:hypothetical protein